MNVIVANEQQNMLSNLDVDIIKSIAGSYDASEIVEMFQSFFYSRMILDVTAIHNYTDIKAYESLSHGLDLSKIIFLLPEGSVLCTPQFLTQLISIGIYNFTTNLDGIKYLLRKPNHLEDVDHIRMMAAPHLNNYSNEFNTVIDNNGNQAINEAAGAVVVQQNNNGQVSSPMVQNQTRIIGVRNVTEHAGATTFIYLLKKELSLLYGSENVFAIEVDKNDFQLFRDQYLISLRHGELKSKLQELSSAKVIFVDLNQFGEDSFCHDIIYLLEPSTIQLNRLIAKKRYALSDLIGKKVVLNKSLLTANDVSDFEKEAGIEVFYNMPPLDDRKRNDVVNDFLSRVGLLLTHSKNNNAGKIFGLFRR